MINNRQNGRRRGRGGARPQSGPGSNQNGSRIDNRARGNAAQLHEKYKTLARDAQMGGDRVMTEYYLQFADHYFRILNENRARSEDGQQRRGGERDDGRDGAEDDFDGEEMHGDEFRREPRRPEPRREPRSEPRDDERWPERSVRGEEASDEANGEAPAAARPAEAERAERPAGERPRRGRPRREEHAPAPEVAEGARLDADRIPPAVLPRAVPAQANDAVDELVDARGEAETPAPRVRRVRRARVDGAAAAEV